MKLILNILLIMTIVATFSICAIKPDMHKSVLVFDSAYKIIPEKQVEVETQTIPIMEKTQEPVQTVIKKETIQQPAVKQTEIKKQIQKVEKTSAVPAVTKTTTPVKQQTMQTVKQVQAIPKTETVKTSETKTVNKPPVKETVQTTAPTVKVLTQKEEEIAWNVWRSNLQNKIMQDVKLPILPTGIVFKFSFTVDKFGKISNVQTWSTTASYTPYAIQYIAPVIRSYQGKSILNFPSGTSRVVTDVKGGWRISENEKYSTPQDYHDIERIRQ